MAKERYIQVGVTAMRDAMGNPLPAVPIYIKTTEPINESGLTASEENVLHDVAGVFARGYQLIEKEAQKY